jgi:hypothetical protein
MHQLFTLGYAHWDIAMLQAEIHRLGATLVDVRTSPRSKKGPEWCREGLAAALGDAYMHVGALGNRNAFRGGPIELVAPQRALAPMRALLALRPAVLMCGCAQVDRCHRLLAAEYLAGQLGLTAPVHLQPPPPNGPRPITDDEHGLWFTALTLWQPWASLIALEALNPGQGKWVETRSWPTAFRGRLVIHAAKGGLSHRDLAALCADEPFRSALSLLGCRDSRDLPRGAVVAVTDLVDCVPTEALLGTRVDPQSPNAAFGDYTPGRFGWVLQDIRPVDPPLHAQGGQQLWRWRAPDTWVVPAPAVGRVTVPAEPAWTALRLPGFS